MPADSSQIRFLFRPTERFISCRGGSLRPPARLQQSRFRAMKEKSKIKLPARFTARWHAPRIRCARRHADSRKGCPYDSIKPASGSGKEKYYPAACSNSVHGGMRTATRAVPTVFALLIPGETSKIFAHTICSNSVHAGACHKFLLRYRQKCVILFILITMSIFQSEAEILAVLKQVKRLVVKVGTSTLTYDTGRTNIRRMHKLVSVLSDIVNSGIEVALVTSGAIGVGVGKLGLSARPEDTPGRQAAATVGQCELMFMYDKLFAEYGHTVGQMLITKSDVDNPERRQNLINAFEKIFEFGAIPIINENDSVAVEEIVYGDNDSLSAIVAALIGADALVILTDIDGLYDANPTENEDARLIPEVREITPALLEIAGGHGSRFSTGGMVTKLHAAQIAMDAGIDVIVMNGTAPEAIYKALDGKQVGTFFVCIKEK